MSTPVSPTGPPTEWPPQARGPITKLPPELLLETLDHLLAQLPSPLKRQRACQLFLRVNRAFNEAYHLSSASKECILTSVNQVTKLVDKLEYWAPGSARVRHLTIDLEHKRLFSTQLNPVLLARLIKANSTELKRSTVKLRQEGWSDGWKAEPSLTLSWAECTELVEFEFSGEDQEIGSSQAKSWVPISDSSAFGSGADRISRCWVQTARCLAANGAPPYDQLLDRAWEP